jgi:uncharacterized protein
MHGDMKTMERLKNLSKDVDGVVCAGDVTSMERNLPNVMKKFSEFHSHVLMIHGNHEEPQNLKEHCDMYTNITFLHKGAFNVGDYLFLGYGGDGFSTNDPEFEEVAKKFFKPEIKDDKRIIFVTHGPAHGTELDKVAGSHKGSISYRKFIDDVKPHLVISGHLHENEGKSEKIGRTMFINPGRQGAIIEI